MSAPQEPAAHRSEAVSALYFGLKWKPFSHIEKWLVGDIFHMGTKKGNSMNNQIPSIAYIKRQAKNLKKENNIPHNQALEIMAKSYGFSNWQHCQRSLSGPPVEQVKVAKDAFYVSFTEWLKKHKKRNSPLGDLSSDMLRDKSWPSYDTLDEYRGYLHIRNAADGAIAALERGWKSYNAFLNRKNSDKPVKPRSINPAKTNHDLRRVTYVKNVRPLHYNKRTTEKFNPGDKAWISWDGSKALPVTIVEVDETNYKFKVERPLNKRGGQYSLFLDEVRSTPELACLNRVTS